MGGCLDTHSEYKVIQNCYDLYKLIQQRKQDGEWEGKLPKVTIAYLFEQPKWTTKMQYWINLEKHKFKNTEKKKKKKVREQKEKLT